jgi:hypothetical protein
MGASFFGLLGRALAIYAAIALVVTVLTRNAHACAVCSAGNPNVSVAGAVAPLAAGTRATLDLRLGTVRVGDTTLHDRRIELGFGVALSDTVLLSAHVPGLSRDVRRIGAPPVTRVSLGDVEARANVVAWSDFAGPTKKRLLLLVGLKAPTAPLQRDGAGELLPVSLQPGCGSIVPALGFTYVASRGIGTFATGLSIALPYSVREGPHPGDSVRTSTTFQVQALPELATRFGLHTKLDSAGERAPGEDDRDSGGFVGYAGTELVLAPVGDLVVSVGALFPAVQVLRGDHREGAVATATFAYDF